MGTPTRFMYQPLARLEASSFLQLLVTGFSALLAEDKLHSYKVSYCMYYYRIIFVFIPQRFRIIDRLHFEDFSFPHINLP